MSNEKYDVLYTINAVLHMGTNDEIISYKIKSSDIVSLSFIHNYDSMTYPIIRLRIYPDITFLEKISEHMDELSISITLSGNIYKVNPNDQSSNYTIIKPCKETSFAMKVYIENKNTPVTTADLYDNGLKRSSDLNDTNKIPMELYCYNESIIHSMKYKAHAIYRDTTIDTVIRNLLSQCNVSEYKIDPVTNQKKYDQILIPNLNIAEAFSYLDTRYGIYETGGAIYGDFDSLYISNTRSHPSDNSDVQQIYVKSFKSDDSTNGLIRSNNGLYYMKTMAQNVSVITETNVERVLNAPMLNVLNVNTMESQSLQLKKLYKDYDTIFSKSIKNKNGYVNKKAISNLMDITRDYINTPDIIHKSLNEYIPSTFEARLNERISRIDISGSGYDILSMNINSRYSFLFETPLRGRDINDLYRPVNVIHTLTNSSGELFYPTTTMQLVSN